MINVDFSSQNQKTYIYHHEQYLDFSGEIGSDPNKYDFLNIVS